MRLGRYLRDPALLIRKARWRLLYEGPRRDVTVESYNGRLTFDSRDKLIGKHLYVHRSYETRIIETTLGLLRRNGYVTGDGTGTVLDVGANIGMICIALLKHGYFQRAIAFEPAPDNLRLLQRNVTQNGYTDRIACLPYALSGAPGELVLELSEYNSGDHRIRQRAMGGAYGEQERATVTVPVRTLDAVLDEIGAAVSDIRLLWVDIQGHEAHFFEGARQLLRNGVPVVSEFWPYGILRSGTSRAAYARVTRELFTHVYHVRSDRTEKLPIAAIDGLFEIYASPKQMCELVLVRDS